MGQAVTRVTDLWNEVIDDFLSGRATNTRPPLDRWFAGYEGQGRGSVDTSCLPEPYLGDLGGSPRAAVLALNPGGSVPSFQARNGIFANEIGNMGSYQAWAKSWPYLREPWGYNRHHVSRMNFLKRWFRNDDFACDQRVDFELYPWHSNSITAAMRPDSDIIHDYIWAPLAELPIEFVFAFGAPWFRILEDLPGVKIADRIGDGGRPYATTGKPGARRAVVKASTPTGAWLIVEKHSGSAAPPAEDEVKRIREALGFA